MKIDLIKVITIANFIAVVVFIFVFLLKDSAPINTIDGEKRFNDIDSVLKEINQRKPIEEKIYIIDNETIKKVNGNDTIRNRATIDSLFTNFSRFIKPAAIDTARR
jgi:hypothetical protein